jgi:hypothetical protein
MFIHGVNNYIEVPKKSGIVLCVDELLKSPCPAKIVHEIGNI